MNMKHENSIHIKGARVHNLKNIEVEIPHDKLVVVTGLSGSGKSTLAFDTIFAEGQRRYVESLSAYARQFLGKINKPDVDLITGIAPAIAIEQKVNTRNPRSTVGTTTEIYDYLKLLYARIGRTYSPVSGREVRCYGTDDVAEYVLAHAGERVVIAAPLTLAEGQGLIEKLTLLLSDGLMRVHADGEVRLICLDPGHFHASLLQKNALAELSDTVRVYAPEGEEVEQYLAAVASYNGRAEEPTSWREVVYTGPDYLERMVGERAGDLVVLAGNNRKKTGYILASVKAGYHVLSDKPLAVCREDFDALRAAYADSVLSKFLCRSAPPRRMDLRPDDRAV